MPNGRAKGLFLEADRGTLFLDEIGDLPLHMQAKLLHVIEDKQVRALGGEQSRRMDARISVATNDNLTALVNQGRFREDLYFRSSVFEIALPPLRSRLSCCSATAPRATTLPGLHYDTGPTDPG